MQMRHSESKAFIPYAVNVVFDHINDHASLSSHMGKSSWMMGGGQMQVELDEARGKSVGSKIRLAGQAFGVQLFVEEMVTEYRSPVRKVWETTAPPKLLVIGRYRMGVELTPMENGTGLRVFIDYALPERLPARWLGTLFGKYYAHWCTQQMVDDTVKYFSSIR